VKRFGFLLVAGSVLLGSTVASAAPSHDKRAKAMRIDAVPFSASGSTAGATLEPGEPRSCDSIGATVWFRFTATQTLPLAVSTGGSGFDTILAVWRVTSAGLQPLDCEDDNGAHPQSFVSFPAVAGDTFYIQLGGWRGETGRYKLRLTYGSRFGVPLLAAGMAVDDGYQEVEFGTGAFVGGTLGAEANGSLRVEDGSVKESRVCPIAAVIIVVGDCL
jgi:hypothetical protein